MPNGNISTDFHFGDLAALNLHCGTLMMQPQGSNVYAGSTQEADPAYFGTIYGGGLEGDLFGTACQSLEVPFSLHLSRSERMEVAVAQRTYGG